MYKNYLRVKNTSAIQIIKADNLRLYSVDVPDQLTRTRIYAL